MPSPPHTVTFDCWGTLLLQPSGDAAVRDRVGALVEAAAEARFDVGAEDASAAMAAAFTRHEALWVQGVASGAAEMAVWALTSLGIDTPGIAVPLARRWEEAALGAPVDGLDGADGTLDALVAAGVRTALVCDTGFSSGRVVRELLDRVGLLRYLEVTTFSDEVGVPKPHPLMFTSTLAALGAEAAGAVHVGDLRRTDVAGARGVGMGTVRISWAHDDVVDLPDADTVAASHADLASLLGVA